MRMNKRGSEMTIGTIIMIVLGITVLVFLIYGFSSGWGNLWDKVTNLGGGDVNVGTVRTACVLACQQGNVYGFDTQKRTIVLEDGVKGTGSCKDFAAGNMPLFEDSDGDVGFDYCNRCHCHTIYKRRRFHKTAYRASS